MTSGAGSHARALRIGIVGGAPTWSTVLKRRSATHAFSLTTERRLRYWGLNPDQSTLSKSHNKSLLSTALVCGLCGVIRLPREGVFVDPELYVLNTTPAASGFVIIRRTRAAENEIVAGLRLWLLLSSLLSFACRFSIIRLSRVPSSILGWRSGSPR